MGAQSSEGACMNTPPETMPVRVQLKRAKGWKMPENTIKVDRSTKWGNPFKLDSESSRLTCLSKFKTLVKASHDVLYFCSSDLQEYRRYVDTNVTTLRGKNLACWCRHFADILASRNRKNIERRD